jgi:hypothetical protein
MLIEADMLLETSSNDISTAMLTEAVILKYVIV